MENKLNPKYNVRTLEPSEVERTLDFLRNLPIKTHGLLDQEVDVFFESGCVNIYPKERSTSYLIESMENFRALSSEESLFIYVYEGENRGNYHFFYKQREKVE